MHMQCKTNKIIFTKNKIFTYTWILPSFLFEKAEKWGGSADAFLRIRLVFLPKTPKTIKFLELLYFTGSFCYVESNDVKIMVLE